MHITQRFAHSLPHPAPTDDTRRTILFAMRQMGAKGLDDAATAHAFMTHFGKDFRRPLTLMRTLMLEMSRGAAGPITIAPWCCRRMTAQESSLLAVIERASDNPGAAALLLADLMGVRDAGATLTTAQALAFALQDCGRPLTLA